MKKLSAFLSTAAVIGFVGISATPAMAAVSVPCRDGRGYTEIHNEQRHCFANAGHIDVYITNVYKILAGNNNITVHATYEGDSITFDMPKGGIVQWAGIRYTIEDLTIH